MLKKLLLALALCFINVADAYQYDLAICAISKDDENYLKEWIEFHKLVGVQHFYIFCHGNWDNYVKILHHYIASGEVELLNTNAYDKLYGDPNSLIFNKIQCQAYSDLNASVRNKVKWLAFIDTDEFLFSPKIVNLRSFFSKYEHISNLGGIGVNWQMFGTSWVPTIPVNKTLIESLTRCAARTAVANDHIKTIVRPERVNYYENPHYPLYFVNFKQYNTDLVSFDGPRSPYIQVNLLRINHYWTRDQDFYWNYKVPRRMNWEPESLEFFQNKEHEYNAEYSDAILRFVPALRKRLKLPK